MPAVPPFLRRPLTHTHTVPLSSGFSMPSEMLPCRLSKLSFTNIPQKYWFQGAFQLFPGCWTSLGSNSQAKRFQAWLCHLLVASHKSQWLPSTHPVTPRPGTKVPIGNLTLMHIWQLCYTHTHTMGRSFRNEQMLAVAKRSWSAQPRSASTYRKSLPCLVSEAHPSPFLSTLCLPLLL